MLKSWKIEEIFIRFINFDVVAGDVQLQKLQIQQVSLDGFEKSFETNWSDLIAS